MLKNNGLEKAVLFRLCDCQPKASLLPPTLPKAAECLVVGVSWTTVLFFVALMGDLLGFQGTKKDYVEKEKQLPRYSYHSI